MKITCDIEGGPEVTLHGSESEELFTFLEEMVGGALDDPNLSIDIGQPILHSISVVSKGGIEIKDETKK